MKYKTQNWKKQRKSAIYNEIDYRCFIFCEGEKTEPHYFSSFKKLIEKNAIYKNTVQIEVKGLGLDTLRIIYYAQDYITKNRIENAHIWCVYDKDDFPAEDFNNVAYVAGSLNNRQDFLKYKVAWSNQCIEYWFVLHFEYYHSDNDRKHYISFLNEKLSALNLHKYEKNSEETFNILLKYGDPIKAIKHAKRRICDCSGQTPAQSAPATTVHELVEELAVFLPDGVRNRFI